MHLLTSLLPQCDVTEVLPVFISKWKTGFLCNADLKMHLTSTKTSLLTGIYTACIKREFIHLLPSHSGNCNHIQSHYDTQCLKFQKGVPQNQSVTAYVFCKGVLACMISSVSWTTFCICCCLYVHVCACMCSRQCLQRCTAQLVLFNMSLRGRHNRGADSQTNRRGGRSTSGHGLYLHSSVPS